MGGEEPACMVKIQKNILYTIYTTVYKGNMNLILHNGGILENHYQWVFQPPSLHKSGSWH